jgi:mRNA interferase RelE/StbE
LPNVENPRLNGKALQGNLKGLWRYRLGDYRLFVRLKTVNCLSWFWN